jgi:hypothetical protein
MGFSFFMIEIISGLPERVNKKRCWLLGENQVIRGIMKKGLSLPSQPSKELLKL